MSTTPMFRIVINIRGSIVLECFLSVKAKRNQHLAVGGTVVSDQPIGQAVALWRVTRTSYANSATSGAPRSPLIVLAGRKRRHYASTTVDIVPTKWANGFTSFRNCL
ncbi:hypothetical protein EVAR_31872_1 [Eumeta japonica]|uniref:Uncharacterized protein n=1 Tax=Eumeta variegata TaxID=151549 RepID=A0A4C1WXG4_EUMVA|nr:hypothetical protein EVAR_31872_1 [Eumeta japonica]